MRHLARWLAVALFIVSCSGRSAVPNAAQGEENGSCYPNGTCNAGLTCIANACAASAKDGGSGDAVATDRDAAPSDARDETGAACPSTTILHPGIEMRNMGTSVPFIGRARDPLCVTITGAKLVWTDNLEAPSTIGTGESFNYTFTMTGTHTVTLTATDALGRVDTATVTFMIL